MLVVLQSKLLRALSGPHCMKLGSAVQARENIHTADYCNPCHLATKHSPS